MSSKKYDVEISWTPSHQDGEFFNTAADKLARSGVKKNSAQKEKDLNYIFNDSYINLSLSERKPLL